MPTLTAPQVYRLALDQGLTPSNALIATAIAYRESGFRTDAVGVNGDSYRSRDRGLWQINDHWNPDVSDQCAFDPVCSAGVMARLSNKGTNWKPWHTADDGASLMKAVATVRPQILAGGEELPSIGAGVGANANGVSGSATFDPGFDISKMLEIPGKISSGVAWFADADNRLRIVKFQMGMVGMVLGVLAVRKSMK